MPAVMISGLSGFAQIFFVAAYLDVRNWVELLVCGVFGFLLAWVTGSVMIAAGNRSGWDAPDWSKHR